MNTTMTNKYEHKQLKQQSDKNTTISDKIST